MKSSGKLWVRGVFTGLATGILIPLLWIIRYEVINPEGWPYTMGYQYIALLGITIVTSVAGILGGILGAHVGETVGKPQLAASLFAGIGSLLGFAAVWG